MEIHHSPHTTALSYRVPIGKRLFKFTIMTAITVVVILAITVAIIWQQTKAPTDFPAGKLVEIEEGTSVRNIARQLHDEGVIKSEFALYTILITLHDPTSIKASIYKFKEPENAFAIAKRLAVGEFGFSLVRFIHYEGETNKALAERADELLETFDADEFIKITEGKEGRMFPDTYLIPESYTAKELAILLEATYESRIKPLRPAIEQSNYTEEEVIIIASLIEREGNTRDSKRMIASVIENRIAKGMPLQLDASIEYVLDKPLSELMPEDLRIDSPYNTYSNVGLPPTPIGNPGLTSIEAVLRPTESDYLFYLTGRDGNFYFAETLAQHNANIATYLR